jgi:HPt (histidine-containing phosphotransfer) domain-containing protein
MRTTHAHASSEPIGGENDHMSSQQNHDLEARPASAGAPMHAGDVGEAGGILDAEVLNDLRALGGEDEPGLLTELIDIFLADAPKRLQEISTGLGANDLKTVERAAHTLKSSSANIGAIGLSKLCKEMEEIARERKLESMPSLLTRSTRAMSEVESALRAIQS